ncbi:MAG: TPM domain-containing protein [Clostridiaceae bacterium]|nr:TPM domain-containing protein [Clostridiaceae bacterium]
MKKRNLLISLTIIFWVASLVTGFAASDRELPLLVDDADLLTISEKEILHAELERISKEYKCEVAIVTVKFKGIGRTATEYADDFFDYYGYGYGKNDDGILLLVSVLDRDAAISTHGNAIRIFTDTKLNYMYKKFLPYLTNGNYSKAFSTFVELCEEIFEQARAGTPFLSGKRLIVSLIAGVIFALIVTGIMKGQLKSVRFQPAATNYLRDNSFNLKVSRDLFLYSRIDRRLKPKSSSSSGSSTHVSSSGRVHGGSSRKF